MEQTINWKLVNVVSIPSGLILGWIFTLNWNKFLKYAILLISLIIVGAIVYSISEKNKKTNTFNAIALTIAITLIIYFLKQIW